MRLPFTAAQFFDVFAEYNRAVWPMQVVLVLLAVAALALAVRPGHVAGRLVAGILAILWWWMAIAYHLGFFVRINPLAVLFAALFAIQATLLARAGLTAALSFRLALDRRSMLAASLIAYALVGYPALNLLVGHHYPATPTFGLPCPTTIFTLGVLLSARPRPRGLLLIPVAWSLLGFSAAWQLGVVADYGLLVAGLVTVAVAFWPPAWVPPLGGGVKEGRHAVS
jgi:hypothetical protein